MSDYLLFATERYALPILQPLAEALHAAGHRASALFVNGAQGAALPAPVRMVDVGQAVALHPSAVFSAANWVPGFIGGAKVQVFHGFNVDKRDAARGHFRVRGLFDLYCTQGPATTAPFQAMAARDGTFVVTETGWPKLDPLFGPPDPATDALRARAAGRPLVLFGSTFTERLSAAPHLLPAIAADIATGQRYWLLTLHPKCPPALFAQYRALAGAHAMFVEPEDLMPAQRAADVLVADTTSLVSEFVVQGKPVVTFRNRAPLPHMLDFHVATDLPVMLATALSHPPALMDAIARYSDEIHPYRDGRSSARVIAAAQAFVEHPPTLAGKPLATLWRRLQIRRELHYWKRAG